MLKVRVKDIYSLISQIAIFVLSLVKFQKRYEQILKFELQSLNCSIK